MMKNGRDEFDAYHYDTIATITRVDNNKYGIDNPPNFSQHEETKVDKVDFERSFLLTKFRMGDENWRIDGHAYHNDESDSLSSVDDGKDNYGNYDDSLDIHAVMVSEKYYFSD